MTVTERDRFGSSYLNVDRALEHARRLSRERSGRREDEPELAEALLREVPRLQQAPLPPRRPLPVVGSATARALAQTYNRIGGLTGVVAAELGLGPAAVLAVWQVESGGRAYTPGDRCSVWRTTCSTGHGGARTRPSSTRTSSSERIRP